MTLLFDGKEAWPAESGMTQEEMDSLRNMRFQNNSAPFPATPIPHLRSNLSTHAKEVDAPSHYVNGNGIECIDAITEAVKDLQGVEAFCTANAVKYLWRWKKKNGIEDLKKALWYIERMIARLEKKT